MQARYEAAWQRAAEERKAGREALILLLEDVQAALSPWTPVGSDDPLLTDPALTWQGKRASELEEAIFEFKYDALGWRADDDE